MRNRDWRRGSWLQRTYRGRSLREGVASQIKYHRSQHFAQIGYAVDRDLAELKAQNFDLEQIIRMRLPKTGRLNVLDSGAGFLGVSAGLKEIFGDRVFVTALDLMMPKVPYASSSKTRAFIRRHILPGKTREPLVSTRYKQLKKAGELTKIVDEIKICPIENFSTRKHYDVIIDNLGPLHQTQAGSNLGSKRVFEKYFSLLKPFGTVYCLVGFAIEPSAFSALELFGKNSEFAKKHGFYLSANGIGFVGIGNMIEIRKLPLPKRQV